MTSADISLASLGYLAVFYENVGGAGRRLLSLFAARQHDRGCALTAARMLVLPSPGGSPSRPHPSLSSFPPQLDVRCNERTRGLLLFTVVPALSARILTSPPLLAAAMLRLFPVFSHPRRKEFASDVRKLRGTATGQYINRMFEKHRTPAK